LLATDAIPDTLKILLRRVASDYLPEIQAMVAMSNGWLSTHKPAENEVVGGQGLGRGLGMCSFEWRGHKLEVMVMPYRIFMLQRIQDAYDGLDSESQKAVDTLLAETGLAAILTTRSIRRVERKNNREVWV